MLTVSTILHSAFDLVLYIEYVVLPYFAVYIIQQEAFTGRNLTVNYWANRAAHLATSQTPLIVALAGKNNIVTLLTGIGYEKVTHSRKLL